MAGNTRPVVRCHALRLKQGDAHPLYLFALSVRQLRQLAAVARVGRNEAGVLEGYQRGIAPEHVDSIATYLNSESPLFPNGLILALPSTVRFEKRRGPGNDDGCAVAGELEIPFPDDETLRPAWIVDGQQRWMALAKAKNLDFPIPVAAFVADSVEVQRDQFIRVNSVKPLDKGLVTELLPQVSVPISPRLAARKLPSALVDQLHTHPDSPFAGLIRRPSLSAAARKSAVIQDTSLVNSIEESLTSASGAFFPHRNLTTGDVDIEAIWWLLITYWTAVRDTFPDAWGKAPAKSRLMHGVGIRSMGRLMDRMLTTARAGDEVLAQSIRVTLDRIASNCRWTSGTWEGLGGLPWDALENTPRHIRALSNFLVREYLSVRDQ